MKASQTTERPELPQFESYGDIKKHAIAKSETDLNSVKELEGRSGLRCRPARPHADLASLALP